MFRLTYSRWSCLPFQWPPIAEPVLISYVSFLATILWRCRPLSNRGWTFPKANASCCLGYMLLLKFKAAYIVHYHRLEMNAKPHPPQNCFDQDRSKTVLRTWWSIYVFYSAAGIQVYMENKIIKMFRNSLNVFLKSDNWIIFLIEFIRLQTKDQCYCVISFSVSLAWTETIGKW